jgi:hypothetical protein
MRYVIQFDTYMDMFDLTTIFQVFSILLVLFLVFTLQIAERLDHLVKRTPAFVGWFRRVATVLYALCILWLMLYQIDTTWVPWPPVVALVIASTLNTIARLVIVYTDYRRISKMGDYVPTIKDALSTMKTMYVDEGKKLPPLRPR